MKIQKKIKETRKLSNFWMKNNTRTSKKFCFSSEKKRCLSILISEDCEFLNESKKDFNEP